MPLCRAAFLTILALLVTAAPAAASERSEARRYAAAMQPEIELTPEEAEALVADVEAKSAHVVATCLPSVEAAVEKRKRARVLAMLYEYHLSGPVFARYALWLREGDDRLAAIPTRSTTLRRARAARQLATGFLTRIGEQVPDDFCAVVTTWEANGFVGTPAEARALLDVFDEGARLGRLEGRMKRANKLLKRHGASRAQRAAFSGDGEFPDLREPAKDPVPDLLVPGRDDSDGAGTRTPSELAG